jgi:hypothetical protein
MSTTLIFRSLVVALVLSEAGLQAQPLVETYKSQEELRLSIAKICQSQFAKAQYRPVKGQEEDLRYMISEKGVQGIKAAVVPSRPGGSYKCDRGSYEQPMLLAQTYQSGALPLISKWTAHCRQLLRSDVVALSECASVRKERLELEPCVVTLAFERGDIEISCLVSYTQLDDSLVDRRILAFRMP